MTAPHPDDKTPMTRQGLWVVALCTMVVLMDGVDAQVMGYAAPSLRQSWSLGPSALGVVFSAGLFGMMAGSMLFGIVGDKLGRKLAILLCVAGLGLFTALTATATSVEALFAWRFAAGVALGGVGPNAYALTAEHSPPKRRALMIMIVATAFPFGGGLGGIVAAPIVATMGWQAVFVVSGLATLVVLPLLFWRLPNRAAPAATSAAATAAAPKKFPLLLLFDGGRAALTLLIWTLYFSTMLGLYFLSNWLPTLAHDVGIPLQHSVRMMSALQFGGVLGSVVVALLLSRFGATVVLAASYVVAAVLIVVIGRAGSAELVMGVAAFGTGACLNGALIAVISLASEFYSTEMRSTGIGWGSALGRIGAALGPLLGGALLGAGGSAGCVLGGGGAHSRRGGSSILFSLLMRAFIARRDTAAAAVFKEARHERRRTRLDRSGRSRRADRRRRHGRHPDDARRLRRGGDDGHPRPDPARRQGLHIVCVPSSSIQADMLIGAGCVASIQAGAVLLYEYGSAGRFIEAFNTKPSRSRRRPARRSRPG